MEIKDSTIHLNRTLVINHGDELVRNTIYYSNEPAIYIPKEVAEAKDFRIKDNVLKSLQEGE